MAKIKRKILRILIIVCLCMIGCRDRDAVDMSENLDAWIGSYTYSEAYAEPDGVSMFMNYNIVIYKEADEYFANVEVMGQTTMESAKVKVHGCEEWVSLSFVEYSSDNVTGVGYEENDVLLSLRNESEEIYTYWGKIEPMLYPDTKSGEICFVRSFGMDG